MWVMTERKLITVEERVEHEPGNNRLIRQQRIFNPGDPAPPGHEGMSYTKRVEPPAPNRMLDTRKTRTRRAAIKATAESLCKDDG